MPYKHSVLADFLPPNMIFQRLKLERAFGESSTVKSNPNLYEPERYPPRRRSGNRPVHEYDNYMDYIFSEEYTDNLFYDRQAKREENIPPEFSKKFSKILKDKAHVSLYYSIRNLLLPHSNIMNDSKAIDKRFFIVQGRIGCGKSTMLWRFIQDDILPEVLRLDSLTLKPFCLTVDFNAGFSKQDMITKSEVYETIRKEICIINPQLNSEEGWQEISREKIENSSALISTSENPQNERLKIVRECRKDEIFTKRVLNYLSKTNHLVIVIFDNADPLSMKSQLRLFDIMSDLLKSVSASVGMIVIREYTLNDLGTLKGMSSYYELHAINVTHPSIPKVISRRFDYALELLDIEKPSDHLHPIKVGQYLTISMPEYREFLGKWAECFKDPDVLSWLSYISDSSIRVMERFVKAILSSSYVNEFKLLSEFYYNRDIYDRSRYGQPWLTKVSTDQFLRLSFLGNSATNDNTNIYVCTYESLIQNVFDDDNEMPERGNERGRFPTLIKYRMMCYLGGARSRNKSDFLELFRIYSYSANELVDLLEWFLKHGFVESKEGTNVNKIQKVYPTKKLGFYIHRLTKFLISLENIRNDTYLIRNSSPHYYDSTLHDDLHGIYTFLSDILDYEMQENEWMVKQKKLVSYCILVGTEPICWRFLRSVRSRLGKVGVNMDLELWKENVNELDKLRQNILSKSSDELLRPRISKDIRDLCPTFRSLVINASKIETDKN